MKIKFIASLLLTLTLAKAEDNEKLIEKADQGHTHSANMVGTYLLDGSNGFQKNEAKAKEYFEKSANTGPQEGNIYGNFMLGSIYLKNGEEEKAFEIWQDMRKKHENYEEKMKPLREQRKMLEKQRQIEKDLDELKSLRKENKRLRQRSIDDLEDGLAGE